ncbi:MAG: CIA30 family protein [Pseudomonadota bacterium]
MRIAILAAAAACLANGPALAETMTCKTLIEHSAADTDNPWQTVNDGVMGGLSSGGSVLSDGALLFKGVTNTNGGGFSSIRIPVERGAMAGADHLKVHMKRDVRTYSMTLRTNVTSFGRRIAFRTDIQGSPEGEWGDGVLKFDRLKASIWGRSVPDAVFDPAEVVEMGIIIYDGEDGPFEMNLSKIEACSADADTGA